MMFYCVWFPEIMEALLVTKLCFFSQYFKTKPFACDPSNLPKYPPSKEIDAKMRDEAKRQQPVRAEKQERQDSMTRISHERKPVPQIKGKNSLSMTMEVSNCKRS